MNRLKDVIKIIGILNRSSIRKLVSVSSVMETSESPSRSPERTVPPPKDFYRRPLPATCIDFSSNEGKAIFTEALCAGYMNNFFKLCAQFRTQVEPAFCGLTSLVMALNALEVDPGRTWKGPWRWYHEDMLDCCTPLDTARNKGINMEQFACLAACNNLRVITKSAPEISSLDSFRETVKSVCSKDGVILICSYSRKTLGQTGDGHFSPVAGFHEGRDLVLILDTARFKYPPHWVPLSVLLQAMDTIDADTGLKRGYLLLSSAHHQPQSLLFRPSSEFAVNIPQGEISSHITRFAKSWNSWLMNKACSKDDRQIIQAAINSLLKSLREDQVSLKLFCGTICCCKKENNITASLDDLADSERKQIKCVVKTLLQEMEVTKIFLLIQEALAEISEQDQSLILSLMYCDSKEYSLDQETSGCCKTSSCSCTKKGCAEKKIKPTAAIQSVQPSAEGHCQSCTVTIKPAHLVSLFLHVWPNQNLNEPLQKENGEVSLENVNICETNSSVLQKLLAEAFDSSTNSYFTNEVKSISFKLKEVLKFHS